MLTYKENIPVSTASNAGAHFEHLNDDILHGLDIPYYDPIEVFSPHTKNACSSKEIEELSSLLYDIDKNTSKANDMNDAANIDELAKLFDEYSDNEVSAYDIICDPSSEEAITKEQEILMADLHLSAADMTKLLDRVKKASKASPSIKVSTHYVLDDVNCKLDNVGNIDSRIPQIPCPRMDFRQNSQILHASHQPSFFLQPKGLLSIHDSSKCSICMSNKSPKRKEILHRWRQKRMRRKWPTSPRYTARSSVASSRTRVNGRFVSSSIW